MSDQLDIFAVPTWVESFVKEWRTRLGIDHWEIDVALSLAPGDDTGTVAYAEMSSETNSAAIYLRADAANNEEFRTALLHELLHIAHGRVDHLVEFVAFLRLPEEARVLAQAEYTHLYESYNQRLAVSLHTIAAEGGLFDADGAE